jgi:hypothetical protein
MEGAPTAPPAPSAMFVPPERRELLLRLEGIKVRKTPMSWPGVLEKGAVEKLASFSLLSL